MQTSSVIVSLACYIQFSGVTFNLNELVDSEVYI